MPFKLHTEMDKTLSDFRALEKHERGATRRAKRNLTKTKRAAKKGEHIKIVSSRQDHSLSPAPQRWVYAVAPHHAYELPGM